MNPLSFSLAYLHQENARGLHVIVADLRGHLKGILKQFRISCSTEGELGYRPSKSCFLTTCT